MNSRKSIIISIVVMAFLVIVAQRHFRPPASIAVFNVVYNGKVLNQDRVEISYFLGMSPSEQNTRKIKPDSRRIYTVSEGNYGPQGFLMKVDPSAVGNGDFRPFTLSFSYWNTNNKSKRTISATLEFVDINNPIYYKGVLTVVSHGYESYYFKREIPLSISRRENTKIHLDNINKGP